MTGAERIAVQARARARDVAHELMGTCKSLSDVASEAEIDDKDFCDELDERVFCCECCSWWCDMAEAIDNRGHGFVCDDCALSTDDGD